MRRDICIPSERSARWAMTPRASRKQRPGQLSVGLVSSTQPDPTQPNQRVNPKPTDNSANTSSTQNVQSF